MKLSRTIVVLFLFLGGCSSCQQNEEPAGGGAAAPKQPAAGAPAGAAGKIQVAPLAPTLAARPGVAPQPQGNPPAAAAPEAGAPPVEGAKPEESDCIVVADANPDYGPPPLAVAFSAEAECSSGQPTFKWTFGDGSQGSSETNPSHTYTQPGDYTASVTVTGPNGATASDEIDITVEEGEAPPQ